jgi:hypothetical protein
MTTASKKDSIAWAAQLPMREISRAGTADSALWTDRLSPEGLQPVIDDGRVPILIITAEGRFKGLFFRELSVSVMVRSPQGDGPDAVFMDCAFNSRWLFAWCERALFSTPYYFSKIHQSLSPVAFEATQGGDVFLRASMGSNGSIRQPVRVEPVKIDGPIFVPTKSAKAADRKLFLASLSGVTSFTPFDAATDEFVIRPVTAFPTLQRLIDSRFQPVEWIVRADAFHAKSKTLRRDQWLKTCG